MVGLTSPVMAEVDAKTKAAIDKWIEEFQPCVMTKEEQRKELEWFAEAAKPYRGMEITSCAEQIMTHRYESETIAKAFYEITGIKAKHEIITEGEVVDRISRQIQTNRKIYDIYINDADLNGWHARTGALVKWNKFMEKYPAVSDPYLDWEDFIDLIYGIDYDNDQIQIPDEQFPWMMWFRYDLFSRPEIKKEFKEKYGYELGVPLNWSAYEDMAKFWTGKTVDGVKYWGHYDAAKKDWVLGVRFTDTWLQTAGTGDLGLPNGLPIDEWGIRTEKCIPVAASVERGGALNSPAAVYATQTFIDLVKKYSPPEALTMSLGETAPGRPDVAQRMYLYALMLSDPSYKKPPLWNEKTNRPNWRMCEAPHGKYWKEGMNVGYTDAGSWSCPKDSVPLKNQQAAYLWAQFCLSKTVDLKKSIVGVTFIRYSTINSKYMDEHKDEFGGMIDFYRSDIERLYTDTGLNIPHYGLMAEQFWNIIADAVAGTLTSQQAMDKLAYKEDELLGKLKLKVCSPKLNPKLTREEWLDKSKHPGSPWPEIKGDPKPATMSYEDMLKKWAAIPMKKAPLPWKNPKNWKE